MKIIIKSAVVKWEQKRVSANADHAEFTYWEPTRECGHPHYGHYYPAGSLPLELDCYECARRGLA